MEDCKTAKSPGNPNEKLSISTVNEDNDLTGKVPFQELVGSLLYIAQITRPDIAFCVNNVSRFNSEHSKEHWEAALHILKYLKNTINYVLRFNKDEERDVYGYSDADYASEIDKRRSCSGFVVKLAGGAISWHSKRQEIVALSSTEAEYIALSTTTREILWISQFIKEISGIDMWPVKIYCDNTSSIKLATTDAYRERTKHIDVRYHHLRENIEEKKNKYRICVNKRKCCRCINKGVERTKEQSIRSFNGTGVNLFLFLYSKNIKKNFLLSFKAFPSSSYYFFLLS